MGLGLRNFDPFFFGGFKNQRSEHRFDFPHNNWPGKTKTHTNGFGEFLKVNERFMKSPVEEWAPLYYTSSI